MPKKSSGRQSVIQNLDRMTTASKSQCMYMDRLEELFGDKKPELTAYVILLKKLYAEWLTMVQRLRDHI